MATVLACLPMQTADDLFGGPQGSPRDVGWLDFYRENGQQLARLFAHR